jgi:threonine/homoserine/homoserine lactone efflux protein
MSATLSLFSILGAILIGAVSPGPSFVVVSRIAITQSRSDGLAAALGVGVGGAAFAALAVGGLVALLMQVGWFYLLLKIAGGAYLVYVGVRIYRGASAPIETSAPVDAPSRSYFRSFRRALLVHLSNPKTAIVYASIFAALLPPSPPAWLLIVIPPALFLVEGGWYAVVAVAFSSDGARRRYLKAKTLIDRLTGVVIGVLGARLLSASLLPHKSMF